MLVALSSLVRCHALASGAISGLAGATDGLILEVVIGFADGAGTLTGFLGRREGHVFRIARKIAIGGVVLFTFVGGVDGLGRNTQCCHPQEDNSDQEYSLHTGWMVELR